MSPPKLCFAFICQSGELEIKALLLATSLRYRLGEGVDLVACVPQPDTRWGVLSPTTIGLLDDLGVRLAPVWNHVDAEYPIANKIGCLSIPTAAAKTIFLDSDIVCLKAFPADSFPGQFAALTAPCLTWTRDLERRRALYAAFDLPVPQRLVMTPLDSNVMPPYFNSGVIAVDSNTEFSSVWEECCRRIDAMESVPNKRPWLDQIALPIAVASLGLEFHTLPETLNFPANLSPLPAELPFLVHYHSPEVLRRESALLHAVSELQGWNRGLRDLMLAGGAAWARLPKALEGATGAPGPQGAAVKRVRFPAFAHGYHDYAPEFVITGIPRSGTSLLCRLLDDLPDCVVVNEPAQVFVGLRYLGSHPRWMANFYRELRADIIDGLGIENKVEDGRVVEDTRISDERIRCYPKVSRHDFLLGTKNTLLYLARIPVIRRAMPDAPIVAMIRHPLDTIASWKSSFPHLSEVDLSVFPGNYAQSPFLTGLERLRLSAIMNCGQAAQRRAMLWSHLAETILANRDRLLIFRYEDLMTDPAAVLGEILGHVPGFALPGVPELEALAPRSRRDLLDAEDEQAIRDLCRSFAAEFGYRDL